MVELTPELAELKSQQENDLLIRAKVPLPYGFSAVADGNSIKNSIATLESCFDLMPFGDPNH